VTRIGAAGYPVRYGPQITSYGVLFNLWAPRAENVELLEARCAPRRMPKDNNGSYHTPSLQRMLELAIRPSHRMAPGPASHEG
jgi:hypothetical protein